MTLETFKQAVAAEAEPPEEWPDLLRALWFARNDRWHESHEIVQDIDTPMASWIHAHLHLIEGDESNAGYWYRRAGKPASNRQGIDAEWERIVAEAVSGA